MELVKDVKIHQTAFSLVQALEAGGKASSDVEDEDNSDDDGDAKPAIAAAPAAGRSAGKGKRGSKKGAEKERDEEKDAYDDKDAMDTGDGQGAADPSQPSAPAQEITHYDVRTHNPVPWPSCHERFFALRRLINLVRFRWLFVKRRTTVRLALADEPGAISSCAQLMCSAACVTAAADP